MVSKKIPLQNMEGVHLRHYHRALQDFTQVTAQNKHYLICYHKFLINI